MGKFVTRWVEVFNDTLNRTYFLQGDDPKPRIFIDDIEGFCYESFGENANGEKMYFKYSLENITYA